LTRVCFMASGRGSNLEAVLDHMRLGVLENCEVALLITNNKESRALRIAESYGVEHIYINTRGRSIASFDEEALRYLERRDIDLVVLAGWDWIVGRGIRSRYEHRLMAIHPSLHPSFTGLLARAEDVHRAVLESGVKVTGCTVYYVGVNVDVGSIILQRPVLVEETDYELFLKEPEEAIMRLNTRVLEAEHLLLSECIQLHIDGKLRIVDTGRGGGKRIVLIEGYKEWLEEWRSRQRKYLEYKMEKTRGGATWQS